MLNEFTISFSSNFVSLVSGITISKQIEIKASSKFAKDAVNQVFPDAFYSYTIRPDCIVFYDPTFGKVYCKK